MTRINTANGALSAALLALCLAACGGGTAGSSFVALPLPPAPPADDGAFFAQLLPDDAPEGLVVTNLAGGDSMTSVSYDAERGVYLLDYDGLAGGFLATASDENGWSGVLANPDDRNDRNGMTAVTFHRVGGSRYALVGGLSAGLGYDDFLVGAATPEGAVPVVGSAAYDFELRGSLSGTGEMAFDFAAGSLSGSVSPVHDTGFSSVEIGTYLFTNPVYSVGATSFSTELYNPETDMGGSLAGLFAGPGAEEVMGSLRVDIIDPWGSGTITDTGVFVGVRR